MTQSQPPITRTTHTLPFDKLSPRDFERLCLWLVEREGYERAEHLGAAGSEQGRDIVAWREGEQWAFQCKRVRSFGPKDALAEVEKVLALPEAERPVGLVFLATCDVSVKTRRKVRARCAGEIKCHFWTGTELDEKVKRYPDIVEEFFQVSSLGEWLDFIAKLPGWLTGLIAFVTTVVGFIKLWQGDTGLVTTVLLVVGVGGGILGCAYLAFKRTPPLVEGGKRTWQYPHWRRWALAGMAIILLLAMGGVGYHLYQQAQPPDKVILLVADFDGPEPDKYRVTETVLARLRAALEPYDDVQVEALGRAIIEAEGSAAARVEGERRKAAIVIWGWYGATAEAVPLSVHFEVLRPLKYMPELGPEAEGHVRTMAVAELESFDLQTRLSAEMTYLSLFTVGVVRLAAEDWDESIACFSGALSQTTQDVSAMDRGIVHRYRGTAYGLKGDYDRAIADLDQAVQLRPDDTEAYSNRGTAYYYKGDYDRAIANYDQTIQLQPDLAGAYINRGNAIAYKGDYDRAIADFDQAIQLQPDLAEAYYYRGRTYADKGDDARAIADYDQAIHLQPDLAEAYNSRGLAYRAKGDYDRAIADFDQAIQLQPDYAKAYNNRGNTYYHKGDYDRAIADYDQAIWLKPDYAKAYNNRGSTYFSKGDYDRAIADYDQAIQLKPDYAGAYDNRGFAHYGKGDSDRAIADFDQVIQLKPDFALAYVGRGLAYRQKGEKDKAIADFKRVLELSNDLGLRQQAEEQLKELGQSN